MKSGRVEKEKIKIIKFSEEVEYDFFRLDFKSLKSSNSYTCNKAKRVFDKVEINHLRRSSLKNTEIKSIFERIQLKIYSKKQELKKSPVKRCASSKTILKSREFTSGFDCFDSVVETHRKELLLEMKQINRSAQKFACSTKSYSSKYLNLSNLNQSSCTKNSSGANLTTEIGSSQVVDYSEIISNCGNMRNADINLRSFFLGNSVKFEELIKKGPPNCFRWSSWMIILNVPKKRDEEIYKMSYLGNIKGEVELEIKKDLNRTVPSSISRGQNEMEIAEKEFILYRLLKSFATYDQEVSYCQGMNYIASNLLMASNYNEIEAFYVLLSLFSKTFNTKLGVRGFFIKGFHLLKYFISLFHHFFAILNPKLRKHMIVDLMIRDEFWISKWFMTLFTVCFPHEVVLRIWDCMFASDIFFLIKFTISYLSNLEHKILEYDDVFDLLDFFNSFSPFENQTNRNKGHKCRIEQILTDALKINFCEESIGFVKSEYERKNAVNLQALETKYDINNIVLSILENQSSESSEIEEDASNINKDHQCKKSSIKKNEYNMLKYDCANASELENFEDDSEIDNCDLNLKMNKYTKLSNSSSKKVSQ